MFKLILERIVYVRCLRYWVLDRRKVSVKDSMWKGVFFDIYGRRVVKLNREYEKECDEKMRLKVFKG